VGLTEDTTKDAGKYDLFPLLVNGKTIATISESMHESVLDAFGRVIHF